MFAPGARYTEGIISGSIGSGKTTFSEMALLKIFYDLTMLTDPQSTFGLMPGSEIVLVCFNRDDKLARDVTYGGVRSKLEQSPYFKEIGCKIANSETYLPSKNISFVTAASMVISLQLAAPTLKAFLPHWYLFKYTLP